MEFSSNQPIYLQIAEYFCENIISNNWKANEKIPSVREIAVTVEVNPNTAMRAYTYLQDKGVIYNKRGVGYFVDTEGRQKAIEMRKTEFVTNELPPIFKTMQLLELSIEDINKLFDDYKQDNSSK